MRQPIRPWSSSVQHSHKSRRKTFDRLTEGTSAPLSPLTGDFQPSWRSEPQFRPDSMVHSSDSIGRFDI